MERAEGVAEAHVPDVVAPPPRHPRFPLSDGARAFAVLSVMIVHVWLFTGGFGFGDTLPNRMIIRLDGAVAIFFFLSGFLLYRPMIAHRAGGPNSPTVVDYVRRRFLRVYPAYWVALTGLAIFPGLIGVFSDKWFSFYSLGFYLDLANSSKACFGDPGFRCGLPQAWTLTVEMTFYVMLPFWALLTSWIARGRSVRSWVRLELALIAVLSLASVLVGGLVPSIRDAELFRFSFLAHFLWLGLGLAAAVLSVAYHNRRHELPGLLRRAAAHPGWCWGLALAIWVGEVFVFYPAPFTVAPFSELEYVVLQLTQALMGALLLIPVVFGNPNFGIAARVFGNPVMLWLGLISYGLYLWSVTITIDLGVGGADEGFWTVLVLSFLITLPFAAASYYLIERPLMVLKYHSPREIWRRWRGGSTPLRSEGA
jgi:peptidoglycan/LPS O-acetylase OafA/YrhL